MLKVLKFGGSSLADARQFAKVKSIVEADPARRVVIVSAPGKRFSGDHKITDLLYLCAAHIKYGVICEDIFDMIRDALLEIAHDCGLKLDLEPTSTRCGQDAGGHRARMSSPRAANTSPHD